MLVSRWTIVGVLVVSFAAAAAAQEPPPVDANTARLEHEREDERERLQHEAELIQRERERFAASRDDHMKRFRARIIALAHSRELAARASAAVAQQRAATAQPSPLDPEAEALQRDLDVIADDRRRLRGRFPWRERVPTRVPPERPVEVRDYRNVARQVFELANVERRRAGLSAVRWDEAGSRLALDHARELAREKAMETFHPTPERRDLHTDRWGRSSTDRLRPVLRRCGAFAAAENLAFPGLRVSRLAGWVGGPTPVKRMSPAARAVWDWMHSSGHRRNLLNPSHTTTAVGVASSAGQMYVAQVFWTCSHR